MHPEVSSTRQWWSPSAEVQMVVERHPFAQEDPRIARDLLARRSRRPRAASFGDVRDAAIAAWFADRIAGGKAV